MRTENGTPSCIQHQKRILCAEAAVQQLRKTVLCDAAHKKARRFSAASAEKPRRVQAVSRLRAVKRTQHERIRFRLRGIQDPPIRRQRLRRPSRRGIAQRSRRIVKVELHEPAQPFRRIVQCRIDLLTERGAVFQFVRDKRVARKRIAHLFRSAEQASQRIRRCAEHCLRFLRRSVRHPRAEHDIQKHAANHERDHGQQQHGKKQLSAKCEMHSIPHAPPPFPVSSVQRKSIASCEALAHVKL